MTIGKRMIKQIAVGAVSLALVAPVGFTAVSAPSQTMSVSASRVKRRPRRRWGFQWLRRLTTRRKRSTYRQKYEVSTLYVEAKALRRHVNSKRLHMSNHRRRVLRREANDIYRQALTMNKDTPR